MLNIKVLLVQANKSQTMRFNGEMSVGEVTKAIREKTNEGGDDHGLYQPPVLNKSPGRWLKPERTLQFFDITSGSELHYKKKHRNAKVKLLDGTVKTILIDESLLVKFVVEQIGFRLNITQWEEYALQAEGRPAGQWLNPDKTLQENDVYENNVLLLKRRFHFSDQNIDTSDPIQLHLLYVQCRDGVVKGDYPTEKEEAIALAALQLQVELGVINPAIHKPGHLSKRLHEFLPTRWASDSSVEKEVLREWASHSNLNEANGKFRYVQLVRSLKTYGITVFLVEQSTKKGAKTKLTKIYLGVTKDSVMRMDYKSKELMSTNNLTHIRRWAFTDKTFTLDFGEYADDYFSFVTSEGEVIAQLIGGYIEIILKRKKEFRRPGIDEDPMLGNPDGINPNVQAISTSTTGFFGPGYWGDPNLPSQQFSLNQAGMVAAAGARPGTVIQAGTSQSGKTGATGQQIPITDINTALASTNRLISELSVPGAVPQKAEVTNPEDLKKNYGVASTNVHQSVGVLCGVMSKGNFDKNQANALAAQVAIANGNLVAAARALQTDYEGLSLVEAARSVSEAIAALIEATKQTTDHPNDPDAKRQLDLAQERFKAAMTYMNIAQTGALADQPSQDLIAETAKLLQAAAQQMANTAGNAAEVLNDPYKDNIKAQAKGVQAQAKNAVQSIQAVTPGVTSPSLKTQLVDMSEKLATACAAMMTAYAAAPNAKAPTNEKLNAQNKDLQRAVEQLKSALQAASGDTTEDFEPLVKNVAAHVAQLQKGANNPKVMVASTKAIALASNDLVNGAKLAAQSAEPEDQLKIKQAAADLADKTQKLVTHAKLAAANPNNGEMSNQLVKLAGDVLQACQKLSNSAKTETPIARLAQISKSAAASSSNLLALTKQSAEKSDPSGKEGLNKAFKDSAEPLNRLVASIAYYNADPKSAAAQTQLLEAIRKAAPNGMLLVAGAKSFSPNVQDDNLKYSLAKAADSTAKSIQSLIASLQQMEKSGESAGVQEALEALKDLQADIDVASLLLRDGLLPPPSNSKEDAIEALASAINRLTAAHGKTADIAKKHPDQLGGHAKQLAGLIGTVGEQAKAVAGNMNDKSMQGKILDSTKKLASAEAKLVNAARAVAGNPNDKNLATMLDNGIAKANNDANDVLNSAKGLNYSDIDDSISAIQGESQRLKAVPEAGFPNSNIDPNASAESLAQAARSLAIAINQLVASARVNPAGTGAAAKMTSNAFAPLIPAANNAAQATKGKQGQEAIVTEAQNVSNQTAQLLKVAKLAAGSHSENDIATLAKASQQVADAINNLITLATPGKRELAVAKTTINSAATRAREAQGGRVNLDQLNIASRNLSTAVNQMNTAAKGNPEKLGDLAKQAAVAISDIVAATYVEEGSDDYSKYSSSLKTDIATLKNPATATAQILGSTKSVAGNSQNLLTIARRDAAAISDPARRQALLNAAKDLANATSSLAAATKAAVTDPSKKGELATSAAQLSFAVDKILESRPDPSDVPRNRDELPAETKEQIMSAIQNVANKTVQLVNVSQSVQAKPKDAIAQSQHTAAVQNVEDAILQLTNARNAAAPGSRECDTTLETIQAALTDLDSVALSMLIGDLARSAPNKNHAQCRDELTNECKNLAVAFQALFKGSNSPEQIGKAALGVNQVVPTIVNSTKDAASTTTNKEIQKQIVALSKDLVESCNQLIAAAKEASLDTSSQANQKVLQEKAKEASESLQKMVNSLKSSSVNLKDLDDAIETARLAGSAFDGPMGTGSGKPFNAARADLQKVTKELAGVLQLCISAAKTSTPERLNSHAKASSAQVTKLVEAVRATAQSAPEDTVKKGVPAAAKVVAASAEQVLKDSKVLVLDQRSQANQKQIANSFENLTESVANLLAATRAADIGERDAESVSYQIGNVVADLDTSALFSAAGELEADIEEGQSYDTCDKAMLASVKAVLEASRAFAATSKGSQADISKAVKVLGAAVNDLAKNTKKTAALIPDIATQQQLLMAAKAACISSQALVINVSEASRHGDAESQNKVAVSAKDVDTSLSHLVNVSKTAAAEAAKGLKEIEAAKTAIKDAATQYDAPNFTGKANASAEDLVKAARNVSAANAHLISANASNSQEELMKAAVLAREAVKELFAASKGASALTNDNAVRGKVKKAAIDTGDAAIKLLDASKHSIRGNNATSQKEISERSAALVNRINDVVNAARDLPGGAKLQLVEDQGEDLDELAEKELLATGKIIEEATRVLAAAKPTQREVIAGFDATEIVEAILEASRAINSATSNLVKSAAEAQRMRVQASKDPKTKHLYHKDPTWSTALANSSKAVSAATQNMSKSAQKLAKGGDDAADEQALVNAAKELAKAAAQLVATSRAKADPTSRTQQKLSEASKVVTMATNNLMNAAKTAMERQEEARQAEIEAKGLKMTAEQLRELDHTARILKLEKQLEDARKAMSVKK